MTKTINIPLKTPNAATSYDRGRIDHVINLGCCTKRYGLVFVRAGDSGRQEYQGPLVPGPWAQTFEMAGFIDNHGGSRAESERQMAEGTEHVVSDGDQLVIDGVTFAIRVYKDKWSRDERVALDEVRECVLCGVPHLDKDGIRTADGAKCIQCVEEGA